MLILPLFPAKYLCMKVKLLAAVPALLLVSAALSGCVTPVTGGPRRSRPADATAFGGHWYKVVEEKVSWHEARRRCAESGGYLACVETAEEQEFIARLAAGRYLFLGGTDEAAEDRWAWVNGAPFSCSFWMSGQPNNYDGNENYLAAYEGGEWIDVAGEGEGYWMPVGYLCEWER